jgi:predicted Zn-dependent protease
MEFRTRKVVTASLGRQFAAALLVALYLASPANAVSPAITFPAPHATAYSHAQEIQLGRQAKAEVYRQMQVLPDSDPIAQYVRSLGERLVPFVPNTDRYPRFPYEFHVVNRKEINAFALPGGPVFVNLGAIRAADNEAQLVGVIAHEMSHVYERHATANATKESSVQGILGILGAILGNRAESTMVRGVAGIGAGGLFLHYSRSAESEADHVGALLMYMAGYNPQALADFFRKLEHQGGAGTPQFLSDHPNPGNRAEAIDRLMHTLPARQFTLGDNYRFQQVHQYAMSR